MDFILILLAGLGGKIFYYSNGYQQVFKALSGEI